MLLRTMLFASMMFFIACSKNNDEALGPQPQPQPKTPVELLTQGIWFLAAYGSDTNKNGLLDMSENSIQECENDNKYTFFPNGAGEITDNVIKCTNGVPDLTFGWQFAKQNSSIIIGFTEVRILKLNEDEFILSNETNPPGAQPTTFITAFKH